MANKKTIIIFSTSTIVLSLGILYFVVIPLFTDSHDTISLEDLFTNPTDCEKFYGLSRDDVIENLGKPDYKLNQENEWHYVAKNHRPAGKLWPSFDIIVIEFGSNGLISRIYPTD